MSTSLNTTIRAAAMSLTIGLMGVATTALADSSHNMSFFVTSDGMGDGANLGGLAGADGHCNALAAAAGSSKSWSAYLSTSMVIDRSGETRKIIPGIHARDRIGSGPWYNAKGVLIATSVDDLHSENANISRETALDENGNFIKGRGESPNEHDILTGSDPQGQFSTAGGDTTCGNWTKNGEGSAIVGHHDRIGLDRSWNMRSWNSSHGSRGCGEADLPRSGGAGLFYCFATN